MISANDPFFGTGLAEDGAALGALDGTGRLGADGRLGVVDFVATTFA
jgi:hypothetical protein